MVNILDIKANLNVIKTNIKGVVEDALKKAGEAFGGGGAGGKEGKGSKKTNSLLGTIAKKLGILGFILAFKPILDLISIAVNIAMFGLLTLLKILPSIGSKTNSFIEKMEDKIVEKLLILRDAFIIWLSKLPERIWNFMKLLAPLIKDFLFALPAKIWALMKFLGPIIGDFILRLIKVLPKIILAISNFLKAIWAETKPFLKDLWIRAVKNAVTIKNFIVNKLGELKDKFVENLKILGENLIDELPKKFVEGVKLLTTSLLNQLANLFGKRTSGSKGTQNISGGGTPASFQPGGFSSIFGGTGGFTSKFGDFISRPGQRAAEFSPEDTIIGVKDIGNLGNTTNNFFGVTPQEMIDVIKRELGLDLNRSGRF